MNVYKLIVILITQTIYFIKMYNEKQINNSKFKIIMKKEMQQLQEQQQFKIPQTIESHKRQPLTYKVLSTLSGIDTTRFSIVMAVSCIVVIATFVVLRFVPNVPYGVSIGVCSGVCVIVALAFNFLAPNQSKVSIFQLGHKLLASALFGYLWAHHLFYSKQSQLLVLSLISIISSIGPIILTSVAELTSPTLYIKQLNVHSVLYVRLLLPLPFFVIELILDYGKFLSQSTHHLYYIRLAVSLVFLTWMLGWISTVYNTYFYIVNNINKFMFGDQTKANFSMAINSLIFNCIPIAIYLIWAERDYPYWILWVGSSITSIIGFIASYAANQKFQNKPLGMRNLLMLLSEVVICVALLVIMLKVNFSQLQSSIEVVTIIDVSLYVFFSMIRFLSLPRNFLGLKINITALNNQYMRAIERVALRIAAGFTVIILIQNLSIMQLWMKLHQYLDFDVDLKFIKYFFIPFLLYRSYKRSLSESTSFSFHLSVLISLVLVYSGLQMEAILVVLFFPPFPHNFAMILVAPFTTPKKLSHKIQLPYQLLYICITVFSAFIYILSIGTLQFTMFFGLPVFMCVLPTINQGNKVKSKQQSLYEKIIEHIPQELLRFQKEGFYLIRISKYILLAEIKEEWYGFGQIIDFKGLQVQEVTSCHSKEGETIDKLVEQTWGENNDFFNTNHLWTVLTPLNKSLIHVPTQNEIQLTGIIESQQFVDLFKQATLKALAYEVSKLTYTKKQLQEGEQIIGDFSAICKREKFQSIFPLEFSKSINLGVEYPTNTQNIIVKKKLPPLKNKKEVVNDFMDLLQVSNGFNTNAKAETSTQHLNSDNKPQNSQEQQEINKQKTLQSTSKVNVKQLNTCLIMTLFHYSVGKFDYLNVKKVYDLINIEKGQLSQVRFDQSEKLISKALSLAFKTAIDKTTMGENQIQLSDFQEYEKNSFLGIAGSNDFNQAVSKDLTEIWTLNYAKDRLSVKRLAKAENQMYMFRADACIIKAIWNNLRFQLIYAANDNDERYSIQTHPFLMRNLWTEACQEPFGYPSLHSGNLINN